jgi:hypothetical protein
LNEFYHLSGKNLATEEIVQPGNWGAIILKTGPTHSSWAREINLEHVRLGKFSHKPCRYRSTFAFLTLEAMLWWRKHERVNDRAYVVEVLNIEAPFHRGDMLGVEQVEGYDTTPEMAAHRYWTDGSMRFSNIDRLVLEELVTESPLRVLKVL